MLKPVVHPDPTCHIVCTVVEAAVAVYLPVSHATRESLSVCVVDCAEPLSLPFRELALVFQPILRIFVEIFHVDLRVGDLEVVRGAESIE